MTPQERISLAYRAYLGRTPSEEEMNYQFNAVRNGMPLAVVLDNIVHSSEAAAHATTVPAAQQCQEHGLQLLVTRYLLDQLSQRQIAFGLVNPAAELAPPAPVAPVVSAPAPVVNPPAPAPPPPPRYRCRAICLAWCRHNYSPRETNAEAVGNTRGEAFQNMDTNCREQATNYCNSRVGFYNYHSHDLYRIGPRSFLGGRTSATTENSCDAN
jgi:hypothetical protein